MTRPTPPQDTPVQTLQDTDFDLRSRAEMALAFPAD